MCVRESLYGIQNVCKNLIYSKLFVKISCFNFIILSTIKRRKLLEKNPQPKL